MNPTTVRPLFRLAALFIICLLPSIAAAQIPQFDAFYVFGDSLADNGNILIQTKAMGMQPPVPPSVTPHRTYFNGRFSNGYIAFEYLWQRLSGHKPGSPHGLKPSLAAPFIQKPGALDFAFGGTGTPYVDKTPGGFSSPGLKGQVELFRLALLGRKPSPRALYAVSTGSNDYRYDAFHVPMDPADVVRNIEDAIVSLYRLGARNVLVVDMPDFAKIPAYGFDPMASFISRAHNDLLYLAIPRLQARFPQLHLILVKLDPLLNDLTLRLMLEERIPLIEVYAQATPGMSNCLAAPATCIDMPRFLFNNRFGHIFWDVVHPTTEAHDYLGDYMYDLLASEYE
jgi:phospholipase/lecithinase/hemolysin